MILLRLLPLEMTLLHKTLCAVELCLSVVNRGGGHFRQTKFFYFLISLNLDTRKGHQFAEVLGFKLLSLF